MPERLSERRNVATYPCEVCGDERPAYLVQLTRHDVSDQFGLDAGSLERIVRCCGDRRDCLEVAGDPVYWRLAHEPVDHDCGDAIIPRTLALDP
jgi:hypothetical protein